jgi:HAD superfamily phosphatase (TIGR01668 family)
MFGYFIPDIIYDTVYDIDFDMLKKNNIKGLIFDIDNTLVSYQEEKPTDNVINLLNGLKKSGFDICFISNNSKERVDLFNSEFKYFSFPNAKKPSVKYIKEAMKVMGLTNKNTAIIGDQIFTDVFAAKRMKIKSILVTPIEPVETLFFKFKRIMEKPFLKQYYKRLNKNDGKKI